MAKPTRQESGCPHDAAIQAIKRIGGRWKLLIVRRLLRDGPTGFNALQRALEGVSAKMLNQQLQELIGDGLVMRHELVAEAPKTVRYELTATGRALGPVIATLSEWGAAWTEGPTPPRGSAP